MATQALPNPALADEEKGQSCPPVASCLVEVVPDHRYSVHEAGY